MYSKTVIFGCGGHARSVLGTIQEKQIEKQVYLVDENAEENEIIMGCQVLRTVELSESDLYIVAIGDNQKRKKQFNRLAEIGKGNLYNVISSFSTIKNHVVLGKGVFISGNSYIGPEAQIGDNVIINTGSIIEHEVTIGQHTHIAPHATVCGRTLIGEECFIGAGTTIIDHIQITDRVIVGAGSVVIKDIIFPGVYAGNPVRKIRDI